MTTFRRPTALVLRHIAFEHAGLIAEVLNDHGWSLTEIDATALASASDDQRRDIMVQASTADLLVVLGAPVGVNDAEIYPWIDLEQSLIADRLVEGSPVLGICLGAQLLAAAAGGSVRAADTAAGEAKEIGYAPVMLTEDPYSALLAPLAGVPVLHWHGDRIVAPSRAHVLASTDTTDCQALVLTDADECPVGVGLQFHIEADHREIERWLVGHCAELAQTGIDPHRIRTDAERYGPKLATAAREVISSIVSLWSPPGGGTARTLTAPFRATEGVRERHNIGSKGRSRGARRSPPAHRAHPTGGVAPQRMTNGR